MPSASDELRDEMGRRFGDRISEYGPMKYLEDRGFVLTKDWYWTPPAGKNLNTISRDEFECILFLVHEWDFGGLVE